SCVILDAIMRPDAGCAVGSAARTQRGSVKSVDLAGCLRAQANMSAAFMRHFCHPIAQVDPELRIGLAEADGRRPCDEARQPERGERRLIEARGAVEIGYTDGDVIDHGLSLTSARPISRACRRPNPSAPGTRHR